VKSTGWLAGLVFLLGLPACAAQANGWLERRELERANQRLHGQVIDHTNNHGKDRRIWSEALGQLRDLYVYVPPGYDPKQCYPVVIWLHGFAQDEHSFLEDVIPPLDRAIADGKLPPVIVAAPDGSLNGRACWLSAGSFFLNTKAGNFENFLVRDVWSFLVRYYPIRPEPEAHVLAGVSMGGGAAFNLGIKYRDCFKVVVGIFPPLNNRWLDCHGRYMGNFDPNCWSWRTDFQRGHEVVGRFYGVVTIRLRQVVDPLYDRRSPQTLEDISRDNPIEMIDRFGLKDGELAMYVAYGGKDQFNIDAQVESFLFVARQRGLCVSVGYDPKGKHDRATALKLMPGIVDWLAARLAPYSPPPAK
jgi:pimeloyl-ACP methyl ester carboxylesterase